MNVNLEKYRGKSICVAVSGGKDSMALLYYLHQNAASFGITLSALNCNHAIRGISSERDSQFVKDECKKLGVPLICFVWDTQQKRTENSARKWRMQCYAQATLPQILTDGTEWQGAYAVATAHHQNDNAETVLFNLARGTSLSGLKGISDTEIPLEGGSILRLVRPLIACSRGDIDGFIVKNCISYVTDETNLSNDYTRNKIRHLVLPELENAVNGAVASIYRFSRLAAEDEEYFARQTQKILSKKQPFGYKISFCEERVIFKRAATKIICAYGVKDYTAEQLERLYALQFSQTGKRFEFLGLIAFNENGSVSICSTKELSPNCSEVSVSSFLSGEFTEFCGQSLRILRGERSNVASGLKVLKINLNAVPATAVVRFARSGDRFTKFGGGTKSLGDFFTDKKIPRMARACIPLIADGNEILCVCGVEISQRVRLENGSVPGSVICVDYTLKI